MALSLESLWTPGLNDQDINSKKQIFVHCKKLRVLLRFPFIMLKFLIILMGLFVSTN